MLVYIIRDYKYVMLLTEIADHLDFVLLVNFPERIVWIVENDSFGFTVEQRF